PDRPHPLKLDPASRTWGEQPKCDVPAARYLDEVTNPFEDSIRDRGWHVPLTSPYADIDPAPVFPHQFSCFASPPIPTSPPSPPHARSRISLAPSPPRFAPVLRRARTRPPPATRRLSFPPQRAGSRLPSPPRAA